MERLIFKSFFTKANKKNYAEIHKDKIQAYIKDYRETNKEKIKAHKSKVCVCDVCHKEYTHTHKTRHEKSKFHLNELAKNIVHI